MQYETPYMYIWSRYIQNRETRSLPATLFQGALAGMFLRQNPETTTRTPYSPSEES